MLAVLPDILKKNKGAWHFSEEEPWKPVANENASEEIKEAIAEFISTVSDTQNRR